jgi:5'-nucleotidase
MNVLRQRRPMKLVFLLAALSVGIWLTWCAFVCEPSGSVPDIKVVLLHLNDTYEITPLDGGRSGGLARVATLARELRKAHRHTYVVHAGDFLSPSVSGLVRIDGKRLAGKQMVAVLQSAGVDYIILGNHEFDLAEDDFRERLRELTDRQGGRSRLTLFSTNVRDAQGNSLPEVRTSEVLTIQDAPQQVRPLRIALLGLSMKTSSKYATFVEPVKAATEELRRLERRGRPDSIIALTHQPVEEDEVLAREVPRIDLILGGHEHENAHHQPHRHGEAQAVSLPSIYRADANARTVYIHELYYDPQTRRLRRTHSKLEPITDAIAEDPDTARVVEHYYRAARQVLKQQGFDPDQELGRVNTLLDGREKEVRNRSTRLTEFIGDAMLHAIRDVKGPQVAICNAGAIRIDDRVPPGPLKMYEVLRMLPFGGQVMLVPMKGDLLKHILDRGEHGRGTGAFLQVRNVAAQGSGTNRVWKVAGSPLDPGATYQVAINDYLLSGREKGFEFLGARESAIKGKTVGDWRKVVANYLRAVKGWPERPAEDG